MSHHHNHREGGTLATMSTPAADTYLEQGGPVLDVLAAYARQDQDWSTTKQRLLDHTWVGEERPRLSGEQATGVDADWYQNAEDKSANMPGSWDQVVVATTLGIISTEQRDELLAELREKYPA